jgi:hypothetical protein
MLTVDRPIIVGAIRWADTKMYADAKYNLGAGLPQSPYGRLVVIVAYHNANQTYGNKPGDVEAEWAMIGHRQGRTMNLKQGKIRRCLVDHDSGTVLPPATARFIGCPSAHAALRLANALDVAPEVVFDAMNCEVALLSVSPGTPAMSDGCADQRRAKLASLAEALTRDTAATAALEVLMRSHADEESASFWFSCSLGCCTADII